MDQEGGLFKMIDPNWVRLYVATQEISAVKIDIMTKPCSLNMPFAEDVCI